MPMFNGPYSRINTAILLDKYIKLAENMADKFSSLKSKVSSVNGIKPDENGNVNIDVSVGEPGKSAYEYAVEGGYTGTEEEFTKKLASEYPIPDWEQNDETAPDYIKNKPFYYEKTWVSWDANTDGLLSVDASEFGGTFYKISDLNGFTVGENYALQLSLDGQVNTYGLHSDTMDENVISLFNSDSHIVILVVLKENTMVDVGETTYSFSETGFYCLVIPELAEVGNGRTILMNIQTVLYKLLDKRVAPYFIQTVNNMYPDAKGNVIAPGRVVINVDITDDNLTQSENTTYWFSNVSYKQIVNAINRNENISFYNASDQHMYNSIETELGSAGGIIATIIVFNAGQLYHIELQCAKDGRYFKRGYYRKVSMTLQ